MPEHHETAPLHGKEGMRKKACLPPEQKRIVPAEDMPFPGSLPHRVQHPGPGLPGAPLTTCKRPARRRPGRRFLQKRDGLHRSGPEPVRRAEKSLLPCAPPQKGHMTEGPSPNSATDSGPLPPRDRSPWSPEATACRPCHRRSAAHSLSAYVPLHTHSPAARACRSRKKGSAV